MIVRLPVHYWMFVLIINIFFPIFFFFSNFLCAASGQAVDSQVSSLSPPCSCLHFFIALRVQQSYCSSIDRVLLTHALALSASQVVHKKKSQRIYSSSMHSAGLKLSQLTYTRLEERDTPPGRPVTYIQLYQLYKKQ